MFRVIENSVNLDAVKFDAFYLVKLIFGKYFCYFNTNCIADLLQLHLQLDAIRVLVRERVNVNTRYSAEEHLTLHNVRWTPKG